VGTGVNGLTNNGSISFTGGVTTVNGDVTNAAGKTISVSFNPATFTGNVTNNGLFETMSTTVNFSGTFTNDGEYYSDPSTQNFANLAIGKNGSLVGSSDDTYKVSGNVTNVSSQAGAFNIKASTLTLEGTVNHQFTWSGADLGATAAGYDNNFAIGTLELQAGGSLTVLDGNESGNAGVYVSVLELDGGLAQIGSITGNGANIYYDASAAGNAYLGDQDYALQNGGELEAIQAIPEPGTVSLLAMGMLVGMGLLGRRKKQ
jgi:PEP-CTERM motif